MDGTGALFERFMALDPIDAVRVSYPTDEVLGYDALAARVALPDEPYLLIAESFSGPVAVKLAARRPPGLIGVVLVATFVANPTLLPALVVPALLFGVVPPRWALAIALTGGDRALAAEVQAAIRTVAPAVMAHRLAEVLRVDVSRELAAIDVPVLVLRARRDRLVRASAADRIVAGHPGARIVDLDAPHLVLQTAPGDALAAIRAGFDSAGSRR